ncbi:MAG: HlyD family efflux transporter periplasmic adaptor subunit [Candidatus Methanoplasma sp.]|jgi:multidrug resistance efflux pump|nr:HlyD family efflux transporter periplasmic adaptor subunit [Candidatus Methanoplasma sp.]
MSRLGEYDLKRLSDSRIQYLRNPPKFTYIFTLIVILAVAAVLVWGAYSVRAEEVRTSGVIAAGGSTIVSPEITGVVSEVIFREGAEVEEGDAVIKFDHSDIDLALERLRSDRDRLNTRTSYIDRFVSATYGGDPAQPFSDTGEQREFFALFAKYRADLNAYAGVQEAVDSLNYQTRASLLSERSGLSDSLSSIDGDIRSYESALLRYDIRARGPGILHLDSEIKAGMTLQAGAILGSVSSPEDSRRIEMVIPSWERAKLEAGQECRFTVDGLPQTEYGDLRGAISSISENAIITENGAFFRITAEYSDDRIYDSKGVPVKLSDGMTVSVWVTYEKTTHLKYWMDQIGLGDYF